MSNPLALAVLSTIEEAKASATEPLSDDTIMGIVCDMLNAFSSACLDSTDEALLTLALSSKKELISALKSVTIKSTPDTVVDGAYKKFALEKLKPDPWSETAPYWFIRKISTTLPEIYDPFNFVFNFNLRSRSLGSSYDSGELIQDVLDKNFADFSNDDVASMVMCGAKTHGRHDRSFLGWRSIDDTIRFNPIIAACNRLNIRPVKSSFWHENEQNSSSDWLELVNYDEQRTRYYDGDDFLKACEFFTRRFIMNGTLVSSNSTHAFRQSPLHYIAKELVKGKQMQSYVNYRKDFSRFTTVAELILTLKSPNVALARQEVDLDNAKSVALDLIRQAANSAKYHADIHAQVTAICKKHLDSNQPDIELMHKEANEINALMFSSSSHVDTNVFELMNNQVIAEFMAKTDKLCQKHRFHNDDSFLHTFFKRWGVSAINDAIDHMDSERLPVALAALTSLRRNETPFFINESSRHAGEALGKMDLKIPGYTRGVDTEDIAIRVAAHHPTQSGAFIKTIDRTKKAALDSIAPSVQSTSAELTSFLSNIPMI